MNRRSLTIGVAVATLVGLIATSAFAAVPIAYDEIPLTQAELDANWETDRAVPSGGYESVSFEGRDDVLEMRVDPDNRSDDSAFYYTEGLLRQTPGAVALKADLYIDPDWEGQDVRAGLWGVGHDESGSRNDVFPIIEYHQNVGEGFAGWRVWDSSVGWVPHPGSTGHGSWATLEVVLDSENDELILSVDGIPKTIPGLGTATLGEAIINMYNYGPGTPAYDVHVSDFAVGDDLDAKDDCRKGGYAAFGFKNQGQCIASLVSNR